MMNIDDEQLVKLNTTDTVENHAAIFGMTGSGKTHFMKVFAQELTPDVRLTIVDPEGDYGDLRFSRKTVIVGKGFPGHHIDIELTPETAAAAADVLCHYDIPIVILNLSGFEIDDQDAFVLAYLGQLWRNYRFEEDLPPHRIFIDEVQLFAPQTEKTQSKYLLRDMARRARKRQLTLAIATQEPQAVYKPLLNAANYRVFLQVAKGTAMDAIKRLLPASVINVPGKAVNVQDMIASMNKGDALFMVGNNAKKVHIRSGIDSLAIQLLFDDGMLDKLRSLISTNKRADAMKESVKHEIETDSCIEELKERIAFLEAENARLQGIIDNAPSVPAEKGEVNIPPAPPAPILVEIQARDELRSASADSREKARQQHGYKNLLLTVRRQNKLHRQILSYLADHRSEDFDTDSLRIAMGLSANNHFSMTELVKAKLVACRKRGRRNMYSASLLTQIEQHYPLIGITQAVSDIAQIAGLA